MNATCLLNYTQNGVFLLFLLHSISPPPPIHTHTFFEVVVN